MSSAQSDAEWAEADSVAYARDLLALKAENLELTRALLACWLGWKTGDDIVGPMQNALRLLVARKLA